MLEQLKAWDEQLLIFLNQFHSPAFDSIAFYLTKTEFWIPLYAYLLYLIFRDQKKEGWFAVAGIVLSIIITDQITAGFMKPYFERLRPSHEPALEGIVHLVNNYRGGLYGFASSHAANTTGIAVLVFLLLRPKYPLAWTIFFWAAIMSYTRIYLGVHYPGDILAGALVGMGAGYLAFRFHLWLKAKVKLKERT